MLFVRSTKRIKLAFSSDGETWRDEDAVETTLRDRRGGVAKVKALQEELTLEQNKDDADDQGDSALMCAAGAGHVVRYTIYACA